MRRAVLVVCVVAAAATAVLLGGGRTHSARATPALKPLLALAAKAGHGGTPIAILPGAFVPRSGGPEGPCFRDSPGGRCIRVCSEFVQLAPPPAPCPSRATKGRLVPVSAKP